MAPWTSPKSYRWSSSLRGSRDPYHLAEREALQVCALGTAWCKLYVQLNLRQGEHPYLVFNCRPKLHPFVHLLLVCQSSRCNIARHATFMDEDFNKKVMGITKACHRLTAPVNTLERFLTSARAKFEALALALAHVRQPM